MQAKPVNLLASVSLARRLERPLFGCLRFKPANLSYLFIIHQGDDSVSHSGLSETTLSVRQKSTFASARADHHYNANTIIERHCRAQSDSLQVVTTTNNSNQLALARKRSNFVARLQPLERPTSALFQQQILLSDPLLTRRAQQTSMNIISNLLKRLMSSMQLDSDDHNQDQQDSRQDDRRDKCVKRVKINACGQLYTELARGNALLYSAAPKTGIDFDVSYYDSIELLSDDDKLRAPTVCLLHGAPGKFSDFEAQIKYLTSKGLRVLAPNFPDYSATFEHSFRHSPRERLEYLNKFFEALKIRQVDLLIGHSSAVYTMFELLNQSIQFSPEAVRIKSLALFSTPTYNLPPNMAVTPFRLFTLKLFDYTFLRPIITGLINVFVKLQGIKNRIDPNNIENLLIAASAVGYSDFDRIKYYLKLIRAFNIPTYLLVGGKDRLIPMSCYEQLKRDLGLASEQQVRQYSETGQLITEPKQLDNLVEVSQFEAGGHYSFQKYSSQVNEDLYNFLNRKVLARNSARESTKL